MSGMALLEMADRLVSISDLSKGKAGRVFDDIEQNDNDYLVIKNNQPKAVLVSVKEYRKIQEKAAKLEELLEMIEEERLLKLAESRNVSDYTSFEDLMKEEGFTMEELEKIAETVEFE